MTNYLVDKLRPTKGSTVDAYLVGTSIEHSFYVMKLADSSAYSKRYVYLGSHFLHHIREGFATFVAGSNIEEDQFVGSLLTIDLAEFHRIACLTKLQEVRAFDGLPVFDIETRYDALC